jgi:hypothetical protein
MKLKPLGKAFLFTFMSETAGGRFIEKNSGKIILTNQSYDGMGTAPRWGLVVAVGDSVTMFNEGDIVLIESLKWTTEMKFGGSSYWKSDEDKVLAIGADESVTFAF